MTADHVVEKIDGGVFFEVQALANAVGRVEQQTDAKRQIGLAAEEFDVLELAILEDAEIFLVEVGDEVVAAIRNSGDEVNETGRNFQRRRLLGSFCWLLGRWFRVALFLLRRRARRGGRRSL